MRPEQEDLGPFALGFFLGAAAVFGLLAFLHDCFGGLP